MKGKLSHSRHPDACASAESSPAAAALRCSQRAYEQKIADRSSDRKDFNSNVLLNQI